MTQTKNDKALFEIYQSLLDPRPFDLDKDDIMAAAIAAEQGGDLAFLSEDIRVPAPNSLIARAEVLRRARARVGQQPSMAKMDFGAWHSAGFWFRLLCLGRDFSHREYHRSLALRGGAL